MLCGIWSPRPNSLTPWAVMSNITARFHPFTYPAEKQGMNCVPGNSWEMDAQLLSLRTLVLTSEDCRENVASQHCVDRKIQTEVPGKLGSSLYSEDKNSGGICVQESFLQPGMFGSLKNLGQQWAQFTEGERASFANRV